MRASNFTPLLIKVLCACGFAWTANADVYPNKEMETARSQVRSHHGGQLFSLLNIDQLEYRTHDGAPQLGWDLDFWFGGDSEKLWLKSEGDFSVDESKIEEIELHALYSRAITPFWDLQTGLRQDFKPDPSRTYLTLGVRGLARYWFDLDGALFLSHKGKLSIRLTGEYDLRVTQRVILQPRIEFNASLSNDKEIGLGSGLSEVEIGMRLRYQLTRYIAPYLGFSWSVTTGNTADYRRAAGEEDENFSALVGVNIWF